MEVKYKISYLEEVVSKHIPRLSASVRKTIRRAIEDRLMVDPVRFGKPLRFSLKGHRRLRVGDYRIVLRIDVKTHSVIIVAIKHGKEVYEIDK
jgi:mRNA-degrading endonuclease RelE of RelBE toxin-antitoxin system